MKKPVTPVDEKFENQDFDLFKAIEAADLKRYSWFSELTDEQQRKFSAYMMLHWISAVKSKADISSYYLASADIQANTHMFNDAVQRHPELQWLMLCAVSPGMGKQFHQWIPHLSDKIGMLKEPAAEKSVYDYFSKVYKQAAPETVKEFAKAFTDIQRHKYKLAAYNPDMKISDIEILSEFITPEDMEAYEKDSGL